MKYKKDRSELDNWKSLADIFSGLMLMFLLILMLIVLFVGYKDEIKEVYDPNDGDGDYAYEPDEDHEDDDGDGGGGDVIGGGDDEDFDRAAVQVVVVDGDTGKVIEIEGIDFNLYTGYEGEVITLHTYYPDKIPFNRFETTEDGTFFLPEKVEIKTYVLKNISAPDGYLSGGSMAFTIAEDHDWDEPYVVKFPLSMKKHSFAIRVTDSETGDPVPGGVYNVSTTDGKSVGKIICDSDGYGQSGMLSQQNEYVITQSQPNEYYAVLERPVVVALNGDPDRVVDIKAVKTTYELFVVDEYKKSPIMGAVFSVYRGDGALVGEYTSSNRGLIRLQNLRADSSYTIKQTGWVDKWFPQENQINFSVDTEGKINGFSVYTVTGTNRMIRVNISAEYSLLGLNISGEMLTLRADNGQIVHRWRSEDRGTVIEGITPGTYTIERENGTKTEIHVENTAELQYFSFKIFKLWIVIAVIAGFALILLCIIVAVVRKKKKKKDDGLYEHELVDVPDEGGEASEREE